MGEEFVDSKASRGVVGRFAPSPSGRMHLGNLFSALLAWASARSAGGSFLLRFEDIDERCRDPHARQLICEDLRWLGIDWDEDPVVQSQRRDVHAQAFERLSGLANIYPCFCSRADLHAASAPHASDGTPVYAGTCRNLSEEERTRALQERLARTGLGPSWRIEVPRMNVSFCDEHMGLYQQDLSTECGDFVLRRADGVYAYQLVVVVDDADAGVTSVVRGSDLMGSTPRQIWLHELLGLPVPSYAHHPVLLNENGVRLSKREKSLDAGVLREAFGTPEPLVGWLVFLAGLQDAPNPLAAREVADNFAWDNVTQKDVIVRPFGPIESL